MKEFNEFLHHLMSGSKDVSDRKRETRKTYIMYSCILAAYKIGRSSNPKFRERTLRAHIPDIVTLGVLDLDVESELHKKFAHRRLHGEWFRMLSDEVYGILDEYEFDILPFVET